MKSKKLTYINKLQLLWNKTLSNKIPNELKLFMDAMEYKTSEKEEAAEFYFNFIIKQKGHYQKAKKLGLI